VVLPRDSVLVAHDGESSPALSDIAMGARGRAVPWITDAGDTVLLAPSPLFRERSEIEVYYEVRGATTGGQYRHEISVLRADRRESAKKGRPLVTLAFGEAASGSILRSHRTVRLDRLSRGNYIVEVRITGPDGRSEVRRRIIRLL
jgi:hypothetical protein